ncbi:uncharacterized protein [Rutidosis leptorrhynchoides]|uniref:uncharacterized protein n=1 Tax=Rutidosis leptorrhynchoides TaxID=125765 RepID=UPI003A9A3CAB
MAVELRTVAVNQLGQPICANTSKLTHFLGTLARSCKHCPIHLTWTKVSKDQKQELLKQIRSKFVIPAHADTWMLRSIARKVKNWRARLKKKYRDSTKSFRKQVKSRPPEPERYIWKTMVTNWNAETFQKCEKNKANRAKKKMVQVTSKKSYARIREELKKCAKNKANRAKKKLVQVTGKKSYARIREELKAQGGKSPTRMAIFRECFSKGGATKCEAAKTAIKNMDDLTKDLPEGTVDETEPDDVFSKVVGNNKYVAADMYGLGGKKADLWGKIPSRNAVLIENIKLKSDNEVLVKENTNLKVALLDKNGSIVEDNTGSQGFIIVNVPPRPRLKVGDEVFLHNIVIYEKVAKAWLRSMDPTTVVGGIEIGEDWCSVEAHGIIKRGSLLVRPFDLFMRVEDAGGGTVGLSVSKSFESDELNHTNFFNNLFWNNLHTQSPNDEERVGRREYCDGDGSSDNDHVNDHSPIATLVDSTTSPEGNNELNQT